MWNVETTKLVKPSKMTRALKDRFGTRANGSTVDLWDLGQRLTTSSLRRQTGTLQKYGIALVVIIASWLVMPSAQAEISPAQVSRIADAIYLAEGGARAKYGIKSVSCTSLSDCRRVCENTIKNNYRRWLKAGAKGDFLEFLANRYAPVEVHPLNKNWLPNVRFFLAKKGVQS